MSDESVTEEPVVEEYSLKVTCSDCSKKLNLKVLFHPLCDITHLVEFTMKLEEKGWSVPFSFSAFHRTSAYMHFYCDDCTANRARH